MRLLWLLAWRNIWRAPRRSILTIAATGFTTLVLTFFISLQLSSYDTTIDMTTGLWTGSAQIMDPRFHEDYENHRTIPDAEKLVQSLRQNPLVRGATIRGEASALLSSESRTYGALLVGTDPTRSAEVTRIQQHVIEGTPLRAGDHERILLGHLLAKNLKADINTELTLVGQGLDGSLAASVVQVQGILKTGAQEIDRTIALLPYHTFKEVFGPDGAVHRILLKLPSQLDRTDLTSIDTLVEDHAGMQLTLYHWPELLPDLQESLELDFISSWVFYGGLLLVVAITIMNTIMMSLLERTRELGMMRALGVPPGTLMQLLTLESALLVGVGLLLGMICAATLVTYCGIYGFAIPGAKDLATEFNLPEVIYTRWSWAGMCAAPGVLLSFTLLALCYPLWMITRIEPVEAMEAVR